VENWIRIHIKVKNLIRIRIRVMRMCNLGREEGLGYLVLAAPSLSARLTLADFSLRLTVSLSRSLEKEYFLRG
jgi:hypothetical protein